MVEQLKRSKENFEKFLEKYDSKSYEVTFRNLETSIDEVVDEEKIEIDEEKIKEKNMERKEEEIEEERIEINEEKIEEKKWREIRKR